MEELCRELLSFSKMDQLLRNEPMSRHTTFRVGGPADAMYFPERDEQLCAALDAAKRRGVAALVIGNGSNILVRDGGVRGLVVVLGERFAEVSVEENVLSVRAGASMARTAQAAQSAGLSGLEFISGIPGTIGGGCAMNAGAYGGQLSDALIDARVWMDGGVCTLSKDEMKMGYRTTLPLKKGGTVLSARFALAPDDPAQIQARMRELNARRRDKQPLNYPSAGSTFKRPEGYFAGALIEQAGLKGATIGGAQVSEKHAGFVINLGSATATDILALMAHVQDTVKARFGVWLEPEVRILGE